MMDAARYEKKQASGLNWIEHDLQEVGFFQSLVVPKLLESGFFELKRSLYPPESYAYPLDVQLGDNSMQLAFYPPRVSLLTAQREDIEKSRNFELVTSALLDVKRQSATIDARFLLVYIPSEPHVYLPYLTDPQYVQNIIQDAHLVTLNSDRYLEITSNSAQSAILWDHLDHQSKALEAFAIQNDINFLNLTPDFQAKALEGSTLYNYVDTHWNEQGHNLAAEVVAKYILQNK